jgi:uncharacterized protein YbaP (TraB family)
VVSLETLADSSNLGQPAAGTERRLLQVMIHGPPGEDEVETSVLRYSEGDLGTSSLGSSRRSRCPGIAAGRFPRPSSERLLDNPSRRMRDRACRFSIRLRGAVVAVGCLHCREDGLAQLVADAGFPVEAVELDARASPSHTVRSTVGISPLDADAAPAPTPNRSPSPPP